MHPESERDDRSRPTPLFSGIFLVLFCDVMSCESPRSRRSEMPRVIPLIKRQSAPRWADVFNLCSQINPEICICDPAGVKDVSRKISLSVTPNYLWLYLWRNISSRFQELQDQITDLRERKRAHTLAQKRSFFVRMVSDPKIYNPSVAKAMPSTRRVLTETTLSPENVTAEPPV